MSYIFYFFISKIGFSYFESIVQTGSTLDLNKMMYTTNFATIVPRSM